MVVSSPLSEEAAAIVLYMSPSWVCVASALNPILLKPPYSYCLDHSPFGMAQLTDCSTSFTVKEPHDPVVASSYYYRIFFHQGDLLRDPSPGDSCGKRAHKFSTIKVMEIEAISCIVDDELSPQRTNCRVSSFFFGEQLLSSPSQQIAHIAFPRS
jgi:hypothetical protein